MSRSIARFLPVALLLTVTAIFLQARTRGEVFPLRQKLQSFPQQLGSWEGTDVAFRCWARGIFSCGFTATNKPRGRR